MGLEDNFDQALMAQDTLNQVTLTKLNLFKQVGYTSSLVVWLFKKEQLKLFHQQFLFY